MNENQFLPIERIKNGNEIEKAWWTGFLFENESGEIHVTHKYLGFLDVIAVQNLEKQIDSFFLKHGGFKKFTASFSKVDWFGPNSDIRVLRPQSSVEFFDNYLRHDYNYLRMVLNQYRVDDYGFNPHVTTSDRTNVHGVLNAYVLMQGDTVMHAWT